MNTTPRLRWMPLRLIVLMPLAAISWAGFRADSVFWALESRMR